MSSIQQLESQLADAEDQVQSIRQQLREHYLEKAAQYDIPRLTPGTTGNGKPPVNTTGKKRKAKPAKPAAPRKPRIDPNDADRAVIAELSQQDGVGQQAIADVCKLTYQQAGAALKRLVKAGRVSQEGKRPAKYLLQVAPSTDTATDNDSIIPLAEHIISTGDHAPARTVARLLSVLKVALNARDDAGAATYADIGNAYADHWDDKPEVTAEALSAAVAQKLIKEIKSGTTYLYRLTMAGLGAENNNPQLEVDDSADPSRAVPIDDDPDGPGYEPA